MNENCVILAFALVFCVGAALIEAFVENDDTSHEWAPIAYFGPANVENDDTSHEWAPIVYFGPRNNRLRQNQRRLTNNDDSGESSPTSSRTPGNRRPVRRPRQPRRPVRRIRRPRKPSTPRLARYSRPFRQSIIWRKPRSSTTTTTTPPPTLEERLDEAADSLIEDEFLLQFKLLKKKDEAKRQRTTRGGLLSMIRQQPSGNPLEDMNRFVMDVTSRVRPLRGLPQSRLMLATNNNCSDENAIRGLACKLYSFHNTGKIRLLPLSVKSPLMSKTRDNPYFVVQEACMDPMSVIRRKKAEHCQLFRALQRINEMVPADETPTALGRHLMPGQRPPIAVQGISLNNGAAEFLCDPSQTAGSQFESCRVTEQRCQSAESTANPRSVKRNLVNSGGSDSNGTPFTTTLCGVDAVVSATRRLSFPSSVEEVLNDTTEYFAVMNEKLRKYLKKHNFTSNQNESCTGSNCMNSSIAIDLVIRTSQENRQQAPKKLAGLVNRQRRAVEESTSTSMSTSMSTSTPTTTTTASSNTTAGNQTSPELKTSTTTSKIDADGDSYYSEPSESTQMCDPETQELAATLVDMYNNGSIWLSWFVLEDQLYGRDPQNIDASPFSTILYSMMGMPAPLYFINGHSGSTNTPSQVCVPPAMFKQLINAATNFFEDFGHPFYVTSIVGSETYQGKGRDSHMAAFGADLQCGHVIYDEDTGISCPELASRCHKAGHFRDAITPAYDNGCGERLWPIEAVHCSDSSSR